MITREDLEQAICECQAEREPNANTCIKLAAFLTIKDYLFSAPSEEMSGYSYAPPPNISYDENKVIPFDRDSDFAGAIVGKDAISAWQLMDELMSTLKVLNPRLYDGVLRKLKSS